MLGSSSHSSDVFFLTDVRSASTSASSLRPSSSSMARVAACGRLTKTSPRQIQCLDPAATSPPCRSIRRSDARASRFMLRRRSKSIICCRSASTWAATSGLAGQVRHASIPTAAAHLHGVLRHFCDRRWSEACCERFRSI
eukprot:scaffold9120_cov151-Isochrysis_galbana.AAC.6